MKKAILIILGFSMITLLSSFFNALFGNSLTPSTKMAHQITREIGKNLKYKYGLHLMGISEEGPDGRYKRIGFELSCNKILSKEQGRILLISCAKDILASINSKPQFAQYMANYPFTGDNIIINIYIQPPKMSSVYYPNISIFSYFMNNLEYEIEFPEGNMKREMTEKEPFEEAKKIVEEQMNSYSK